MSASFGRYPRWVRRGVLPSPGSLPRSALDELFFPVPSPYLGISGDGLDTYRHAFLLESIRYACADAQSKVGRIDHGAWVNPETGRYEEFPR